MTFKTYKLSSFTKGWFVGDFDPSLIKTRDVEVAVKYYKEGDHEASHHHKVATELTLILEGKVKMNNKEYGKDTIIEILPGQSTDFTALTNVTTVVVKYPGAIDDKYED